MLNDINIEQELSNESIKQLQIICAALFIGVFIFLGVILALYFMKEVSVDSFAESSNTELLLYICLLFSPITILMSTYISGQHLKITTTGETKNSTLTEFIQSVKTYYIVKFATLEAGALFGGVVLILGITGGEIYTNELLWLAILPMLVFFFAVGLFFPTKDKVLSIYHRLTVDQSL